VMGRQEVAVGARGRETKATSFFANENGRETVITACPGARTITWFARNTIGTVPPSMPSK
jgi:hypothetical protein